MQRKKVRLCIVSLYSYPLFNPECESPFGGSEVRVSLLAKELAKQADFDVNLIVFDHGQPPMEKREGVTLHAWPGRPCPLKTRVPAPPPETSTPAQEAEMQPVDEHVESEIAEDAVPEKSEEVIVELSQSGPACQTEQEIEQEIEQPSLIASYPEALAPPPGAVPDSETPPAKKHSGIEGATGNIAEKPANPFSAQYWSNPFSQTYVEIEQPPVVACNGLAGPALSSDRQLFAASFVETAAPQGLADAAPCSFEPAEPQTVSTLSWDSLTQSYYQLNFLAFMQWAAQRLHKAFAWRMVNAWLFVYRITLPIRSLILRALQRVIAALRWRVQRAINGVRWRRQKIANGLRWRKQRVIDGVRWHKQRVIDGVRWHKQKIVRGVRWRKQKAINGLRWRVQQIVNGVRWRVQKIAYGLHWRKQKVIAALRWRKDQVIHSLRSRSKQIAHGLRWRKQKVINALLWPVEQMGKALTALKRWQQTLGWVGPRPVEKKDVAIYDEIGADIYLMPGNSIMTAELALYCKKRGKKYVFLAGSDGDYHPGYKENPEAIGIYGLPGYLMNFSIENASFHVVQSEQQSASLFKQYQREAAVIHNPIDLRHQYAKKTEPKTILWIGKADWIKRPEVILNLAQQLPDYRFTLVLNGSNPEIHERCIATAQTLPNVTLLSYIPISEIEYYFSVAALFINTSVFEGFPNTFLQAAKYGVPIVSLQVNPGEMLTRHACGACCGGLEEQLKQQTVHLLTAPADYAAASHNCLRYVKTYHAKELVTAKFATILADM